MQKKTIFGLLGAAVFSALMLQTSSAFAQTPPKATTPAPLTGTWTVDPAHSSVTFSISHFGISEVHGAFDTVSGTIVANKEHLDQSSVTFTIQAASIDTNMPYRDTDMKSKNYFDVADYPTITFQSTKIAKTPTGYVAEGNLTIKGVTKLISLPFELAGPILDPFGSSRIGVETQADINRVDFGVGGNDTLSDGSIAIGKVATVSISLEATPAKPAQ